MATSSEIGLLYHLTRLSIGLKKIGHHVCVLSEPREQVVGLSAELERAGIRHYTSDHIDKRAIRDLYLSGREIRAILESEKIDLIHAQGATHALSAHFAQKMVRVGCRPPIATSIHHIPMEGFKLPQWIGLAVLLNTCSDSVLPVSNDTRKRLIRYGVNPRKTTTAYNGIDLEVFDNSVQNVETNFEKAKDGVPTVVCVANLIRRKGLNYYLMAAAEILKRVPARFYLVGGGPEEVRLKELARNLGIEKDLVFTGRIPWPMMYSLLAKTADICVSCSLNELFSYYVLECMAAGKPIVATNVGGTAEAVVDGVNGYLVAPRSPISTADAILKLIEDSDRAKEMGRNSRRLVERNFNLTETVHNLTKCYEQVSMRKANPEHNKAH